MARPPKALIGDQRPIADPPTRGSRPLSPRTFSDGRLRIADGEEKRVLNGDQRRLADRIVAKYPNPRSATLPLLFLVQSVEGYVSEAGMREVAEILDLTPAEVLATSSFYTMLKKEPQGEYLLSVCRNLSCTHRGARSVIAALEQHLGIEAGQTTADGKFTLEAAECLATCDGAPSMQVNYEDFYSLTAESVIELVERLARGEEVRSVRDQPVKSARAISFETAMTGLRPGSPDDDSFAPVVGGEAPPPDMAPGFRPPLDYDKEGDRINETGDEA
ncbi:MAG TPA: NAD(P)H-dependent oxidoreductase subunit E [Actinomycetota bacterium]|nr:NAD(P)H-dependent oxidoreductase subunit E [Actinomycetota bacterium]